jgi:hypothetical protein
MISRSPIIAAAVGLCLSTAFVVAGRADKNDVLIQVNQDFTTDPHWDGLNNRVVADNCPVIHQDIRRGDKYVTIYVHDLNYTARHPKD